MDSHHRELVLNIELVMHMNEAYATEAIKEAEVCHAAKVKEAKLHHTTSIKEAEVCHTTNSCVLQQTKRESMLALKCEAIAEEGQDCQAFMEASAVALQACPPKTHGALMYPLQLLTSNVPLAAMLEMPATTQLQAAADREPTSATSIPSVSEMPAPLMGAKQWHHSYNQGVSMPRQDETAELDNIPEEPPCQKWKEGGSVARPLKENCQEGFL